MYSLFMQAILHLSRIYFMIQGKSRNFECLVFLELFHGKLPFRVLFSFCPLAYMHKPQLPQQLRLHFSRAGQEVGVTRPPSLYFSSLLILQ